MDLWSKIEGLNMHQLKEVYGLLQNYFNSKDAVDEWDQLTALEKAKIEAGILQADEGNTKPVAEVLLRLRKKYGINVALAADKQSRAGALLGALCERTYFSPKPGFRAETTSYK